MKLTKDDREFLTRAYNAPKKWVTYAECNSKQRAVIVPVMRLEAVGLLKVNVVGGKFRLTSKAATILCAHLGHSKIQTFCFGYWSCARCGDQLGDSLGGCYQATGAVIPEHDCPDCRENWKKCTWKDKLLAPDPFTKKQEVKP